MRQDEGVTDQTGTSDAADTRAATDAAHITAPYAEVTATAAADITAADAEVTAADITAAAKVTAADAADITGAAAARSGLHAFNGLDPVAAERALLACCSSAGWARRVAAGRPYHDPEQLYAAADDAITGLDAEGIAQALAGHPRIGERPTGPGHEASAREQAGVVGANAEVLAAIADRNAEYERRFGHVYLVCATGRSAPELLAILQDRLGNDPETEERVTRTELTKINRIRLARMLQG